MTISSQHLQGSLLVLISSIACVIGGKSWSDRWVVSFLPHTFVVVVVYSIHCIYRYTMAPKVYTRKPILSCSIYGISIRRSPLLVIGCTITRSCWATGWQLSGVCWFLWWSIVHAYLDSYYSLVYTWCRTCMWWFSKHGSTTRWRIWWL